MGGCDIASQTTRNILGRFGLFGRRRERGSSRRTGDGREECGGAKEIAAIEFAHMRIFDLTPAAGCSPPWG